MALETHAMAINDARYPVIKPIGHMLKKAGPVFPLLKRPFVKPVRPL
jgi:hypothetical protein